MDTMFTSNNYKDTITRLKFIGKIQAGEKINTKHYLAIVNNDWLTSLLRTFYNFESRNNTVLFVNETVTSAFQLLEQMKMSLKTFSQAEIESIDSINIMTNMYKDLSNSIEGIKNLKKTYRDDKIVVCQLETIVENIELFLQLNNIPNKQVENQN